MSHKTVVQFFYQVLFIVIAMSSCVQIFAQKLPPTYLHQIDSIKRIITSVSEKEAIASHFQLSHTYRTSNIDSSYFYIDRAIDLSIRYQDSIMTCRSFRALGELYFLQSKYDKALNYFTKAMDIVSKTKDSMLYPYIALNISGVHKKQGKLETALQELQATQKSSLYRTDDYLNAAIYLELSEIFISLNLLQEARLYATKGRQICKKANNNILLSWFYYNDANILKAEGDYSQAIELLTKKLETSTYIGADFIDFRISCLRLISDCYFEKKQYKNALKSAYMAHDLFTEENTIFNRKKDAILYTIGRIHLKTNEFNTAEKYLNESLALALENQNTPLTLLCYKDFYTLYKANNNDQKALYYLEQNVSFIETDNNSDLSELVISIKTSEKLRKQYANLREQKLNFEQQKIELKKQVKLTKFERNLIIVLFIGLFILGLLLYNHHASKNEKRIATFRLKALRAQMNPHFIFNTLNGIQSFILNEDKITAYKQLTRFSNSIRFILNDTEQDFISLDKEIEFIKDYVALEKMRFGSRLNFYLDIDNAISLKEITIPTLLIQPIIENAIVHGISNKDEGGFVKLSIFKTEKKVVITIEDDGIGRANAKMIKKKSPSRKKSISSINIAKRLDLLKRSSANSIALQIMDRTEGEGTLVIIQFGAL